MQRSRLSMAQHGSAHGANLCRRLAGPAPRPCALMPSRPAMPPLQAAAPAERQRQQKEGVSFGPSQPAPHSNHPTPPRPALRPRARTLRPRARVTCPAGMAASAPARNMHELKSWSRWLE